MAAVYARVLGQGWVSGAPSTSVQSGLVGTTEHWIRAGKSPSPEAPGASLSWSPSPWVGSGCLLGSLHLGETQPSEARGRLWVTLEASPSWPTGSPTRLTELQCNSWRDLGPLPRDKAPPVPSIFPAAPSYRSACLVQTADSYWSQRGALGVSLVSCRQGGFG